MNTNVRAVDGSYENPVQAIAKAIRELYGVSLGHEATASNDLRLAARFPTTGDLIVSRMDPDTLVLLVMNSLIYYISEHPHLKVFWRSLLADTPHQRAIAVGLVAYGITRSPDEAEADGLTYRLAVLDRLHVAADWLLTATNAEIDRVYINLSGDN